MRNIECFQPFLGGGRKDTNIYQNILGAKFIFKKDFSHFQCSQSSKRGDISPEDKWEKWGFVFIRLLI